jgi:hypothetical protein
MTSKVSWVARLRGRPATTPQSKHSDPDVSVAELLMLPVLMATLSLLMWFRLPTFPEAFAAVGNRIDDRRETIARLADQAAHLLPAKSTECVGVLDPPPVFIERDPTTNTEILGSTRLRELGIDVAIREDIDLQLAGDLFYLMYWRKDPPLVGRRMTRKRIASELERPLAFPYALFYGDQIIESIARGPADKVRGAGRLSAILFDLRSGSDVCGISLDERIDPEFRPSADFESSAQSQLYSQLRDRLLKEFTVIGRRS